MRDQTELTRIESFSDAVFAIAATLLVLELKVPSIHHGLSVREVWKSMGNLWPSYLAFLLSFGTILVMWVNHHYTVRLLNGISKSFLYANGFLLLTITFLPFPTSVLAEYINTEQDTVGVVFYSFACLLINFAFFVWWMSMRRPVYLIKPEVSNTHIKKILKQLLLGLYTYLFTTILSFWFAKAGIVIIIAVDILWITMSLVERNGRKSATAQHK